MVALHAYSAVKWAERENYQTKPNQTYICIYVCKNICAQQQSLKTNCVVLNENCMLFHLLCGAPSLCALAHVNEFVTKSVTSDCHTVLAKVADEGMEEHGRAIWQQELTLDVCAALPAANWLLLQKNKIKKSTQTHKHINTYVCRYIRRRVYAPVRP